MTSKSYIVVVSLALVLFPLSSVASFPFEEKKIPSFDLTHPKVVDVFGLRNGGVFLVQSNSEDCFIYKDQRGQFSKISSTLGISFNKLKFSKNINGRLILGFLTKENEMTMCLISDDDLLLNVREQVINAYSIVDFFDVLGKYILFYRYEDKAYASLIDFDTFQTEKTDRLNQPFDQIFLVGNSPQLKTFTAFGKGEDGVEMSTLFLQNENVSQKITRTIEKLIDVSSIGSVLAIHTEKKLSLVVTSEGEERSLAEIEIPDGDLTNLSKPGDRSFLFVIGEANSDRLVSYQPEKNMSKIFQSEKSTSKWYKKFAILGDSCLYFNESKLFRMNLQSGETEKLLSFEPGAGLLFFGYFVETSGPEGVRFLDSGSSLESVLSKQATRVVVEYVKSEFQQTYWDGSTWGF